MRLCQQQAIDIQSAHDVAVAVQHSLEVCRIFFELRIALDVKKFFRVCDCVAHHLIDEVTSHESDNICEPLFLRELISIVQTFSDCVCIVIGDS